MPDSTRLRPHPQDRFAPVAQAFDLADAAARLRAEPHDPVEGHRQVALYRHGPVTVLLFIMNAGATLEYEAPGLVTIHVLAGDVRVAVETEDHALTAGQLLTIDRGVSHTVRATGSAELLVTVHKLEDQA
jgi:quercetin dioxygenase-like cupin family protein